MQRTYRRRSAAGFTLLELMTAIVVGSVMLSIAVPSFRQMIASSRLTTQANEVVAALNLARSEAIKQNTRVAFCRAETATSTSCVDARGDWRNWIVATRTGEVIRRGAISTHGDTLVVQSTLVNDQALFGPDGLTQTGGALVNGQFISVCAANITTDNMRKVELGAGSRLSTQSVSERCENES